MNSIVFKIFKHVKNYSEFRQIRYYQRWEHRKPIKVLSSKEYELGENSVVKNKIKEKASQKSNHDTKSIKWKYKSSDISQNAEVKKPISYAITSKQKPLTVRNTKLKKSVDMFETIIDNSGELVYTKMEDNDSRIGKLLVDVKSKQSLEKKDSFLLEGKRLIREGLLAGCKLKYVLYSRKSDVEDLKPFLPKVGAQLYKLPYKELQMWSDLSTNPGIMAIFQIPATEKFVSGENIPLTVVCDNIREPGNLGSILRTCAGVGCAKILLSKGCVDLWDFKVLRSSMGAHFKLQIHKRVDWDFIEESVKDSSVFLCDSLKISGEDSESKEMAKVPLIPYYSVDFTANSKNIVLIIGGETEGISENSYKLAQKHGSVRLNIPLSNDVDSLNAGTALGIVAFEIKKQLLKKV